ncbi:MAG: ATP-binding protein [Endozoicomonas sp.]|uniref:ATP-binding protein n=1 Tax=Endozoicomonas sp. TaxID=1892382 RepID=UPI003D9AEA3C
MKNHSPDLFSKSELQATALTLKKLDIYNWGPFGGRHEASIDPQGTAIIGPTGSGKTTLVDALMTLLTDRPKYNLASTGGHESDRDLLSYIRGVAGAGNDSGNNEHIARPEKTVTGISALFANNGKHVRVGALFWIDSASAALADLKRLWLFTELDNQNLDQWLHIHHEGGTRSLKQFAKETPGLKIYDKKKAYLVQLRRYFEVGENAFSLLNRAAGLKQLNSVDEIFRELVLDDRSAFERAAEVANEFNDLSAIRSELEVARSQQSALAPIEKSDKKLRTCIEQLSEKHNLMAIIPIWYAQISHTLWGEQEKNLGLEVLQLTDTIDSLGLKSRQLESQANTLKEVYLEAGGAVIEDLTRQVGTQQELVNTRRKAANDYQVITRKLSLPDTLSKASLQANQQQAASQHKQLETQRTELDQNLQQLSHRKVETENRAAELTQELENIKKRPGSNIPGKFQDFRTDLAEALDLNEQQLPFVAELVEVKQDEAPWRGAIERAIGGHRLRILVPENQIKTALRWVNQRHNKLHVRLLEVKEQKGSAEFLDDGFTRKLHYKQHPYRESLKQFLSGIDRHCVDSPEALGTTPHGMTLQGLMSGTRGRFEKQDQRRLDQDWMTGFDNQDRLALLTEELQQVTLHSQQHIRDYQKAKSEEETNRHHMQLLKELASLEFDSIDLSGAESSLRSLEKKLDTLTSPDSSAAKARKQFERVEAQLHENNENIAVTREKRGAVEQARQTAEKNRDEAYRQTGDGLTDEQQTLASSQLKNIQQEQLDQLERTKDSETRRIQTEADGLQQSRSRLVTDLVRHMERAQKVDNGPLAETGTDIQDTPAYLERLNRLNQEALPEKLNRFLAYLNQSSDQGVTQLLRGVEDEVTIIEERISDLNDTLHRVDFQPGHYLQLKPQRVQHESLRTLQSAQRHLRSAAMKTEQDQGESHYRALENLVQILRDASENKRTVGARALLDPRYRLQFSVEVLDRTSHEVLERRTGSQGGSGGEKEIIASYILTASLSYALCPDGEARPLFGTIVLDEAFSKSSHAVAGRIITALNEFGLHPLFVTPNKEMRLLRSHTRSAILVHRKQMQATLTSLTWEKLEEQAQKTLHALTIKETHEITQ